MKEDGKIRIAHICALYTHIYLYQGEWSGQPLNIGSQAHHQTKLNIISDKMSSCGEAFYLTPPHSYTMKMDSDLLDAFTSYCPNLSCQSQAPFPRFFSLSLLSVPIPYIHSDLSVHSVFQLTHTLKVAAAVYVELYSFNI